jgi:HSP20 family protein
MKNKLVIIIGLILILAVSIQGFLLHSLRQQINDEKTDSLNTSDIFDDWFNHNDDDLFSLFSDFDKVQRDMDQLFGNFSKNFGNSNNFNSIFDDFTSSPVLDFKEEDDNYLIEVELPGAENNSVEVSVDDYLLNIKAETKRSADSEESNYKRSERYSGKLERSIMIPPDADTDKMTTEFEDGLLVINIPKYQ